MPSYTSILIVGDADLYVTFLEFFRPRRYALLFATDPVAARQLCEERQAELVVGAAGLLAEHPQLIATARDRGATIVGVVSGAADRQAAAQLDQTCNRASVVQSAKALFGEQRYWPRALAKLAVELRAGEKRFDLVARMISTRSLFTPTADPLPTGTPVELTVKLRRKQLTCQTVVSRTGPGADNEQGMVLAVPYSAISLRETLTRMVSQAMVAGHRAAKGTGTPDFPPEIEELLAQRYPRLFRARAKKPTGGAAAGGPARPAAKPDDGAAAADGAAPGGPAEQGAQRRPTSERLAADKAAETDGPAEADEPEEQEAQRRSTSEQLAADEAAETDGPAEAEPEKQEAQRRSTSEQLAADEAAADGAQKRPTGEQPTADEAAADGEQKRPTSEQLSADKPADEPTVRQPAEPPEQEPAQEQPPRAAKLAVAKSPEYVKTHDIVKNQQGAPALATARAEAKSPRAQQQRDAPPAQAKVGVETAKVAAIDLDLLREAAPAAPTPPPDQAAIRFEARESEPDKRSEGGQKGEGASGSDHDDQDTAVRDAVRRVGTAPTGLVEREEIESAPSSGRADEEETAVSGVEVDSQEHDDPGDGPTAVRDGATAQGNALARIGSDSLVGAFIDDESWELDWNAEPDPGDSHVETGDELRKLRVEIDARTSDLEEAREARQELEARLASQSSLVTGLREQVNQLQEQVISRAAELVRDQIEQERRDHEMFRSELEQRISEQSNELERFQGELKDLRTRERQALQRTAALQAELTRLRQRAAEIRGLPAAGEGKPPPAVAEIVPPEPASNGQPTLGNPERVPVAAPLAAPSAIDGDVPHAATGAVPGAASGGGAAVGDPAVFAPEPRFEAMRHRSIRRAMLASAVLLGLAGAVAIIALFARQEQPQDSSVSVAGGAGDGGTVLAAATAQPEAGQLGAASAARQDVTTAGGEPDGEPTTGDPATADAGASAADDGSAEESSGSDVGGEQAEPDSAPPKRHGRRRARGRSRRQVLFIAAQRAARRKHYKRERKLLTRALKMSDDARVRLKLSYSHARSGETWPAIYHLKKALPKMSVRSRYRMHDRLGVLYLRAGKKGKACAAFRWAIRLRRRYKRAQRHLQRHCK